MLLNSKTVRKKRNGVVALVATLPLAISTAGVPAQAVEPIQPTVEPILTEPIDVETNEYEFTETKAGDYSTKGIAKAAPLEEQATATAPITGYGTIGITWDKYPTDDLDFVYRTETNGEWSAWNEIHSDNEHAPEPDSVEAKNVVDGTDLVLLGEVDKVQVKVAAENLPENLQLNVLSPEEPSYTEPQTVIEPQIAKASPTATKPTIYTRAQWGANEKLRAPKSLTYAKVQGAFVHHTAGSNDYTKAQVPGIIASIYSYHVKTRGWSDIGYNFLIDKYGRVWEGRYGGVDKAVQGAHTLGYNHVAFAASALGNFETAAPTTAMLEAYGKLFAWKLSIHGVNPAATKVNLNGKTLPLINGHRDVGSTACPGVNLYNQLPKIRALTASVPLAETPREPGEPPVLSEEVLDLHTTNGDNLLAKVGNLNKSLVGSTLPDLLVREAWTNRIYAVPTGGYKELLPRKAISKGWGTKTEMVVSNDLTRDGRADLVTFKNGTLAVRAGTDNGKFSANKGKGYFKQKGFKEYRRIVAAGDLNKDGRNDLIALTKKGKKKGKPVALLLNRKGQFVVRKLTVGGTGKWTTFSTIRSVGDVTGDGYPDLVVTKKGRSKPYLVASSGKQKYKSSKVISGSWSGYSATVGGGDFDSDGFRDLVYRKSDGQLWARLGSGPGKFGTEIGPFGSVKRMSSLAVAPYQGQLAVYGRVGKTFYSLTDSGKFGLGTPVYMGITMPTAINLFHAGDWDGDGYGDVMAVRENGTLIVRLGNGSGKLSAATALGKGFSDVKELQVVGDQTGDGYPDLYGTYNGQGYIWLGQRLGSLGAGQPVAGFVPITRSVFVPTVVNSSRFDWRGVTGSLTGVLGAYDVVARERATGDFYGLSGGSTTPRYLGRTGAEYDLLD